MSETMPELPQPHLQGLDDAFLQFSFAIKIWSYIRRKQLPSDVFDISLTIQEGPASLYTLKHAEFQDASRIELAAGNNVAICFGAVAITLWEAIREWTGVEGKDLKPSKEQMLAALSYCIRCCFAHGTVMPTWKLDPKYRLEYKLGNRVVDLRSADGQPFEYSQIGGPDGLRILRAEAKASGLLG